MDYDQIKEIAKKLDSGELWSEDIQKLCLDMNDVKYILSIEKKLYQYLPESIKYDEDIWLSFVKDITKFELNNFSIPDKILENKNLMLKALRVNKKILDIYPADIFDDKDFVLTMFDLVNMEKEDECEFLMLVNRETMQDKEVKEKILSYKPCKHILVNLPKEITRSEECIRKYLTGNDECVGIILNYLTPEVLSKIKGDIIQKLEKNYLWYFYMKEDVKKDLDIAILIHNACSEEVFNAEEYRDKHYLEMKWPNLNKEMCDRLMDELLFITPNVMKKMADCEEYKELFSPLLDNDNVYNFKPLIREAFLRKGLEKSESSVKQSVKRKI